MNAAGSAILGPAGLAALMAACAPSAAPAKPVNAAYQCGQQHVSISIQGNLLTLKTGTEDFALQRVPAASGAKYAGPTDETTFFWDRGATALLSLRGVLYPECSRLSVGSPTPAASASPPLIGKEWFVEDIDNRGIIADTRVTLAFGPDGRVSGDGSCNFYNAPFMVSGENLSIGLAAVTRRACILEGVMEQEDRFFEILKNISRFEIASTGELIMHTTDGRTMRARTSAPEPPKSGSNKTTAP